MRPHTSSFEVGDEDIFLPVTLSVGFEHLGSIRVANCFQEHVISLLNCAESDIFHGLHEGDGAPIKFGSLVSQVSAPTLAHVGIVRGPERHTRSKRHYNFGPSSPDIGSVVEEPPSSFLVEVPVLVHW